MENYIINAGILFFQYSSMALLVILIAYIFLSFVLYLGEKQGAEESDLSGIRELRGLWVGAVIIALLVSGMLTLSSSSLQFNRKVDIEGEREKQHSEYKHEIQIEKQQPIVDKLRPNKHTDEERQHHFDSLVDRWKEE